MMRIKYIAMLMLGLWCYRVFMGWPTLPDPRSAYPGFIIRWAGFCACEMPYKVWREAMEAKDGS